MKIANNKPISLVQAAQTLYRTRQPNDEQVYRVFQLMKTGALPARVGATPERWTTTEHAIAEFLARSQTIKTQARRTGMAPVLRKRVDIKSEETPSILEETYQHIWRDYFLAVMLRRRIAHRSKFFERAVTAGQVVVLCTLFAVTVGAFRQIARFTIEPPERAAVSAWIEEQTDAYAIETWHPNEPSPTGEGLIVKVDYRYRKESHRWIHTKREFRVIDDFVEEIVSND